MGYQETDGEESDQERSWFSYGSNDAYKKSREYWKQYLDGKLTAIELERLLKELEG